MPAKITDPRAKMSKYIIDGNQLEKDNISWFNQNYSSKDGRKHPKD